MPLVALRPRIVEDSTHWGSKASARIETAAGDTEALDGERADREVEAHRRGEEHEHHPGVEPVDCVEPLHWRLHIRSIWHGSEGLRAAGLRCDRRTSCRW